MGDMLLSRGELNFHFTVCLRRTMSIQRFVICTFVRLLKNKNVLSTQFHIYLIRICFSRVSLYATGRALKIE